MAGLDQEFFQRLLGDPKTTMVFEQNRLLTFSDVWPFKDNRTQKCTAEKMAEAGFYHLRMENSDTSKCFYCGKEMEGWEGNDDPWEEHSRNKENCLFVRQRKPQSEYTLQEFLELMFEKANEELHQRALIYFKELEKEESKNMRKLLNDAEKEAMKKF